VASSSSPTSCKSASNVQSLVWFLHTDLQRHEILFPALIFAFGITRRCSVEETKQTRGVREHWFAWFMDCHQLAVPSSAAHRVEWSVASTAHMREPGGVLAAEAASSRIRARAGRRLSGSTLVVRTCGFYGSERGQGQGDRERTMDGHCMTDRRACLG
jgi:hypothetical protein